MRALCYPSFRSGLKPHVPFLFLEARLEVQSSRGALKKLLPLG